jgi:hypothetical protein
MNSQQAQAMIASTQRLRTHWSKVITNHLTLSLTINVALWSYFIKSFVESPMKNDDERVVFLVAASGISSILLGLWRLYTRYIDGAIAQLYPDFIYFEGKLDVPKGRGTCGYLLKELPIIKIVFDDNSLDLEGKVYCIDRLVNLKKIGDR